MSRFSTASTSACPIPGKAEQVLDDNDAPGQPRELKGGALDRGHEGVGQCVTCQHDALAHSLQARHSHILTFEDLDHRRPEDACDVRRYSQDERGRWENDHVELRDERDVREMGETAGKTWTIDVANAKIRHTPSTNSGKDASARVMTDVVMSNHPSRYRALNAPTRIESGMPMMAATETRNSEFVTRDEITDETVTSWSASEFPRSPVSTPPIQPAYCSTSGRSRFNFSRIVSRSSGVACCPMMARAASPGSACVDANTTIDTSHRVSRPKAIRRSTILRGPYLVSPHPSGLQEVDRTPTWSGYGPSSSQAKLRS